MRRFTFKTPGFAYPGGKVRLRRWLVSMMPRSGRTYAEPFAGRGNVFWLAATTLRFERWWMNDLDTLPFLDALGNVDLADIPFKISYKEAGRITARLRQDGRASVRDHALAPYVLFSGGKDGRAGRLCIQSRSMSRRTTIRNAQRVLRRFRPDVTALDYEEVLASLGADDFAYLDPPYDGNNVGYNVDTVDHDRLLLLLKQAPYRWLLSGYATPRYTSWLGRPHATREVQEHNSSAKRGRRVECVWRNY